jgi:sodium transport system permease protein
VELIVVTDMRHTVYVRTTRIQDALEEYGEELMQARLRQRNLEDDFFTPLTVKQQNVATSTETAGSFLGLIIPGIVISFALSAGMPIAVSSIAGEKKKLTLEPVLFTPVNRFQLVFAKLMAVLVSVIITLITLGISTVIMVALVAVFIVRSLPADKMAAAAKAASDPSTSALAGGYHLEPMAILLFFVAPFLIILLGAAIQILVSAWARNDEEATTYLAPLSLFSGAVVFITMFLDDYTPQLWHYALPVFGTILSMRDLLSNNVDPLSLAFMFGTSTLYALLMIVLAVWMFHREEVVFRT